MRGGTHGQIFCCTLQFGAWCHLLKSEGDDKGKIDIYSGGGLAFEVEPLSLHHTRVLGNYTQSLWR